MSYAGYVLARTTLLTERLSKWFVLLVILSAVSAANADERDDYLRFFTYFEGEWTVTNLEAKRKK